METWNAVDGIRVVRDFADRMLTDSDLDRILHAGRRAGSSKNLQRWTFVVVRDRARLQALSSVGPFAGHVAGAAAAIALITPDPHAAEAPLSIIFDIGRAAQNMVLAAWDRGIGSCPATVYEQKSVHDILALPADRHCEYVLSFGYPADNAALTAPKHSGGRLDLDSVVRYERWS